MLPGNKNIEYTQQGQKPKAFMQIIILLWAFCSSFFILENCGLRHHYCGLFQGRKTPRRERLGRSPKHQCRDVHVGQWVFIMEVDSLNFKHWELVSKIGSLCYLFYSYHSCKNNFQFNFPFN